MSPEIAVYAVAFVMCFAGMLAAHAVGRLIDRLVTRLERKPPAVTTRVHVHTPNLLANRLDGGDRPMFLVWVGGEQTHARRVELTGPAALVHRPGDPTPTGAVAYVETDAPVRVYG